MKKIMNMMMNNWLMKEKIKYILGIEKSLPSYPSKEDFFHIIKYWWYEDMGKEIMHKYKWFQKLNLNENHLYFSYKVFQNYFDKEFNDKIKIFINNQLKEGHIKIIKETQKDIFYEWRGYFE